MNPIEWIRERLHRTCTDLITTQHDAVVDSAQAHHRAEQELVETRAENERLRARVADLETAPERALEALTAPLAIGEGHADPLVAAEKHQRLLWFALMELAIHMESGGHDQFGASLRQMAELHRQRLVQALDTLAGPERAAELLVRLEAMAVEPLTLPAPRQGQEVQA